MVKVKKGNVFIEIDETGKRVLADYINDEIFGTTFFFSDEPYLIDELVYMGSFIDDKCWSVRKRLKRVVKGRHWWINNIDMESESGSIKRHIDKRSKFKSSRAIFRKLIYHYVRYCDYTVDSRCHWHKKYKYIYKYLK